MSFTTYMELKVMDKYGGSRSLPNYYIKHAYFDELRVWEGWVGESVLHW